jgi:predicted GIY-YIG superfamily endonuclease
VSEPTACYLLYDSGDALVYVGVTNNVERRMKDHRYKVWWDQVARREVTWFGSRTSALFAERRAVIAALQAANSGASRREAVILAGRVGWSKYMIAGELKIAVAEADAMLGAARGARLIY